MAGIVLWCDCDRFAERHVWDPDRACPPSRELLAIERNPCYCSGFPRTPHAWDGGMSCPKSSTPDPSQQPKRQQPGYVADYYRGGGKREENGDRPRFDLLWTESQPLERQMLYRDAVWYQKGAAKYGERNWERFDGMAELVRAQASLGRHYAAFMLGLTDEDHAAAVRANVQFIEYIRERLAEPDPNQEGPF